MIDSTVASVCGEVPIGTLGFTLTHEHVIHRVSNHSGNADNTCVDRRLMAEELAIFRQAGGGAICDLTPMGLGADPHALREVSERSGVKIISGIGVYQRECWPDEIRNSSPGKIEDFLVARSEGGDTGVPAGIIGEIASHNENHSDWKRYRLENEEIEFFGVVARVQHRTGLFISTHASLGRAGVAQLRAIIESGGDPRRVVIGHCDAQYHEDLETDLEYYRTILETGAWVQFDMFGWHELMPDAERIRRLAVLVKEGFGNRLLLSMDICRLSQLHRFGGYGFDHLLTAVLPALEEAGISRQEVDQLTVTNPARILKRAL